ncbi:uncharacterized protein BCR38DRAFT_485243 [Pseudomassariella vexata]|uniref:Uncharacterized protein n=1 Tax=Pseudomassariella vexata TaxID=1141098 RepID=A0A1Y2DYC1_9PEZI|nr:uncharacterized protein BCR38DRAFT_485243 [Pseudomassariella vexata]ORY64106.1 hypothetical protein BCR38DRAFT_485243 [Pseudomassariella vexata]
MAQDASNISSAIDNDFPEYGPKWSSIFEDPGLLLNIAKKDIENLLNHVSDKKDRGTPEYGQNWSTILENPGFHLSMANLFSPDPNHPWVQGLRWPIVFEDPVFHLNIAANGVGHFFGASKEQYRAWLHECCQCSLGYHPGSTTATAQSAQGGAVVTGSPFAV